MNTPSKFATTIIASLLASLSGCASVEQPNINPQIISQINTTSEADLFDAQSPLLTTDAFTQTSLALASNQDIEAIDKLLYYFRAFSYYGPVDDLSDADISALAEALEELADSGLLNNQ
ncbi:collagenase, partial [Shewanella sp. 0m-11]